MVSEDRTDYNFDAPSVQDWLNLLYGRTDGYVSIVSTADWTGGTCRTDQLDVAARYAWACNQRGDKGIYARVTTLRDNKTADGRRGSDEDSLCLPGLWADMDIAGPGHKTTKPLPLTLDDCKKIILEAGLPDPTLWVSSGGGFYPWWLFDEPWHLDSYGINFAQQISRVWQDAIAASAQKLGFHYGPVPDLSRVLRIPGTINRKVEGDPRPCKIIEFEGQRFSAVDIASVVDFATQLLEMRRPQPEPAPRPAGSPMPVSTVRVLQDERPGDQLAAQLSWAQILGPAGYRLSHRRGIEEYWVRPGKDPRDGHSVTTNYQGSDLMWVFSTECEGFDADTSYSKFAAWSILNGHGMDFTAAARALSGGQERERAEDVIKGILGEDYQMPGPPPPPAEQKPSPPPRRNYTHDDIGNAERIRDHFGAHYKYVKAYSDWMRWDGKVWVLDEGSQIQYAAQIATEIMMDQAADMERDAGDNDELKEQVKAFKKHIKTSRSTQRINGAVSRLAPMPGMSARPQEFDQCGQYLTLHNGVFNLDTFEFGPHDSKHMLTRQFNATYDPNAKCPRWTKFLEEVLPDRTVREYVKRAMGYTIVGKADRRAIFLLHGESGTGKSQFIEALAALFGDFATTAAAATFRKKRGEGGATNDLHDLKGKRFISSSETSETSELDEELIKRLTGRDQIRSRDLYEKNQSWMPEGVIWLTTNFLPRLNSDDNAIWLRTKPIEFTQVFVNTEADEPNLGQSIAAEEASGMFNWLIEGVREYLELGLDEPEQVTQGSVNHRRESDDVLQFLDEKMTEEHLIQGPDQRIRTNTLYQIYRKWCDDNQIRYALTDKRFNKRCIAAGMRKEKVGSYYFWIGVNINPAHGLAGP